jgi:hypothetical protein
MSKNSRKISTISVNLCPILNLSINQLPYTFTYISNLGVTKMSSGQLKGEATRIDSVEANQLYAELPRPYNSF